MQLNLSDFYFIFTPERAGLMTKLILGEESELTEDHNKVPKVKIGSRVPLHTHSSPSAASNAEPAPRDVRRLASHVQSES